MTAAIESITQASLSLALDAATLRHQAIAHNIANAGAEGFVPMRVKFSAHMDEARRQLSEGSRLDQTSVVSWAQEGAVIEPAVWGATGLPQAVQLDSEVAQMAQNAVHYQALLKGLSKHMGILASAVSEGKR